jgi:hypothetical protein
MDEKNTDNQSPHTGEFKPGDTIRPQQVVTETPADPKDSLPLSDDVEPAAGSYPEQNPPSPTTMATDFSPSNVPAQDVPAAGFLSSQAQTPSDDVVTWSASEFIARQKDGSWYALVVLGTALVAAGVWLLTKDIISSAVIILFAVVVLVYASHKPREQQYELDGGSLRIGTRHYSLEDFRSFSLESEGAFAKVTLTPLKRFSLGAVMYYDPKDEDRILSILTKVLPHEQATSDAIDGLLKRIRF